MVVTPSAVPYPEMAEADLVVLSLGATVPAGTVLGGTRKPTTEWPMHAAIYRGRPEVGAVVHTHATFCTTLATLRREIPPFHYMVALAGGHSIRCAPYAPFGSEELAGHALAALEGRTACLLANHGMLALGATPGEALELAAEVEGLAELYWRALQVSDPVLLSAEEMAEALRRFGAYR
jgi:L-fuculose-phosphate aldolase